MFWCALSSLVYALGLASAECAKPGNLWSTCGPPVPLTVLMRSAVSCVTMILSKLLGYLIIVGALAVKVPQILKIYSSGSAQGVSNLMFQLELVGCEKTSNFL